MLRICLFSVTHFLWKIGHAGKNLLFKYPLPVSVLRHFHDWELYCTSTSDWIHVPHRKCTQDDKNIMQQEGTQRAQTSADPEDPDFGLWTPRSEAWSGSPPQLYYLVSHALLFQKISSKSVHKFASNLTDRQTNRPNQKHNLLLRRR